jgi:putative ABC transport system permease protein
MGQEVVGYHDEIKKMMLMGVSYEAPDVDNTEVAQGRFFTREEENSLSQVAVLGFEAKNKLFGDSEAVGEGISIKGKKYRIVGVMSERGSAFFMNLDDIIYLPLRTMQKRLLGIDHVVFAVAKMKDGSQSIQTQNRIIELMREQHDITDPVKDDFAVNTMDEAQDMMGNVINNITSLLVALVCISLVVGGVGIMNIMYVSVAERTFEIGLRKAVGAKRKNILWQFLSEALFITLGGGIIGVLLGAIFAFVVKILAVNYGLTWTYHISVASVLIAVGFSVFVGLIFGIYPARKAARLDPIEALRRE